MMKRFYIPLIVIALGMLQSCTNLQDEEVPTSLGVDVKELAFPKETETLSITISSGIKWDVARKPSWISINSIRRSTRSIYEWAVDFTATTNDGYDRDETIVITANNETVAISVRQEGEKGKYVAVESVSVSPIEMTLTEGDDASLSFVVSPSNASIKGVSWKSSNSTVANVSQTGQVRAEAEGTTTITVTTEDGNKTASCTVTVKKKVIPVTGVSLNKTSLSLTEGDEAILIAIVTPSDATDKSVTWSSSNTSVASVSMSGVVTAKSAGSATIAATTTDGVKKATCMVAVQAQKVSVTGVSLDKTNLTMTEGETQTLTATVTPFNASDKSVSWSSSNTSVATVSSTGIVTARVAGTSTITAKTNDGNKTATCSVTVQAKTVPVNDVILDRSSLSLTVSETYTLTATVSPSNATDKSVTWSSSNTSVATVSFSGVVTAKAVGTATITVTTTDGGKIATCSVAVSGISVSGVSLDKTNLSMTEGDTQTLTATITPSNATDKSVSWSSSNTSVATVSSSGVVTAKATGIATIAVTTTDGGKKATCSVTVIARVISVTGVSLDKSSISMAVGDTRTLTATITPSNATDKSVTWSSSNTSVATVSSLGVVTAKAAGSATITVTTNDGSKEATCSIKAVNYSYDYIDLGLPSGLKWATCNLGASSPEEPGDYYAWGEIEIKQIYSWDTYKWYDPSNNSLTKYYSSSPSVLVYSDDVAHVLLGGNWRMPTNAEWIELRNYCTWSWITQNGRYGELVTGPNGNSIFLPCGTLKCYPPVGYEGGYYWSSSLFTSSIDKAWCVTFYSSNFSRGGNLRYYGCSIRPVLTN